MNPNPNILLYQTEDGRTKLEVSLENETVWLTQEQMATLFGKAKSTINEHIKKVFAEGELDEKVVVRKFRITTQHGVIVGKTQELRQILDILAHQWETDINRNTSLDYVPGKSYIDK